MESASLYSRLLAALFIIVLLDGLARNVDAFCVGGVRRLTMKDTTEFSSSCRRRSLLQGVGSTLLTYGHGGLGHAAFADGGSSLADRIRERDFSKPLFNLPPREATFPYWLEGEWDVTGRFGGYIFPSTTVEKQTVVDNPSTPGFKQLSIMSLADIGPPSAHFTQRFVKRGSKVVEDRAYNLPEAMAGWLGPDRAPRLRVPPEYEPEKNPNRLSFEFVMSRATNKNSLKRIELFGNAREWELLGDGPKDSVFVMSEYLRQASIYQADINSIIKELIADYQQFSVFTKKGDGEVKLSLLTAGYLQPQDANYFDSPVKPVVLYSHSFDMIKKVAS